MIFDELNNIGKYQGISQHLDTAIAFLQKTDIHTLPLGKTIIDGENVFITVMEVETKEKEELRFEYHKEYMDIQMDLNGTEAFYIGLEKKDCGEPFREADDFGFCEVGQSVECIMGAGKFIICMPEEAHMPSAKYKDDVIVKKAVVKVKK